MEDEEFEAPVVLTDREGVYCVGCGRAVSVGGDEYAGWWRVSVNDGGFAVFPAGEWDDVAPAVGAYFVETGRGDRDARRARLEGRARMRVELGVDLLGAENAIEEAIGLYEEAQAFEDEEVRRDYLEGAAATLFGAIADLGAASAFAEDLLGEVEAAH